MPYVYVNTVVNNQNELEHIMGKFNHFNMMLGKCLPIRFPIPLWRMLFFWSKRLINNYVKYESIADEYHDLDEDLSSCNKLITVYTKSGNLQNARELFDKMLTRNVVTWSALISGYEQHGWSEEALKLFSQMVQSGVKPNQFTFPSALNSCANILALQPGKQVHGRIIKTGFESNIFVGSALVDLYAKCRSLGDARQVFDQMPNRNAISWNVMMGGYAKNQFGGEALKLLRQMQKEDIKQDSTVLVTALIACGSSAALLQGKMVHAQVLRAKFYTNSFVGNAMVDMYARCGAMRDAHQVFNQMSERDVVSWTTMIAGYVQNGYSVEALKLFQELLWTDVKPDPFTFASIQNACANLAMWELGKQLHTHIIGSGCDSSESAASSLLIMYAKCGSIDDAAQVFEIMASKDLTSWNTMVDMYAKCGAMRDAHQVFNQMSERDVVSWTAMIAGYVQNGYSEEALKLFQELIWTDVKPDPFTFACIQSACANLALLELGKQLHTHIIGRGCESSESAGSSLVNMYAKCGSIVDAAQVFERMPSKDLTSWNTMIAGYAYNGNGKEALQLFQLMLEADMKPDEITFLGILSACSHAGLVDEGCHYFDLMSREYNILPTTDHYACMIDLVGRAGKMCEVEDIVDSMPVEPDAMVWKAVLGVSRNHGSMDLGERAAKHLIKLEPEDNLTYALLSNAYAAANSWKDAARVRKMMKNRGLKTQPACSWIQVKNMIYTFLQKAHCAN